MSRPRGRFQLLPWMAAMAMAAALAACGGGSSADAPSAVAGPLVALSVPGYPHAVDVYENEGATRAIVVLHGGAGNKSSVVAQLGLSRDAQVSGTDAATWDWLRAQRTMLVVPQGQHVASQPRAFTWSNYAMSSGQDDKAFLQALAAQIRARYGTVRQLVLIGHSMGGVMTNRMWCESPATFDVHVALSGPASATFLDPATPCAPGSAARPYMAILGDSDDILRNRGAWEADTWTLDPGVVSASAGAWLNDVVQGEFRQLQARAASLCGETVTRGGYSTAGNVDTWRACGGRLALQRVRGAPHGLASIDALMGAQAPLNVINAVAAFADSAR